MEKIILILALITSFNATSVRAEDTNCETGIEYCGICGENCSWSIDNNHKLFLYPTDTSQVSKMDSYNCCDEYKAPWKKYKIESIQIADDIKNDDGTIISHGISEIGSDAFSLMSVNTLTIPNSVTSIKDWTFQGTPLTSLIIPDSVTYIGYGAFNEVKAPIFCASETVCQGGTLFGYKGNIQTYTKDDNGFYQIGDKFYATADLMTHGASCDNAQNCQDILDAASQGKSFEVGGKYYATLDLFANKKSCENQSQCEEMLSASKQNASFIVDGRFYHSLDDFLTGNYERKRIYTVEEAEKVSKPAGNTFKIRYK
ncbi:MAG: leucine-rich repeat protein [Alphaproteobacteria bacterium]|nr:leucine-rich repeat protein [Alphaproteobacteria bacterium]